MIIAHYTACDWLRDYEMDFGDDFDAFFVVYMDDGVSKWERLVSLI